MKYNWGMKKLPSKQSPEIAKILKPYNEDIKRHMSALSEDFQGKVKFVAEQFIDLNRKIDTNTEMVGELAENLEIVKTNVEFIKDSLKKKVDYDDFIALERRVHSLESKSK